MASLLPQLILVFCGGGGGSTTTTAEWGWQAEILAFSLSDVEGKALASAAAEQDSTSAFQPASFTAQTSWDLGHTAEEFCGEIGGEKSSRSCFVRELGGGA